MPSPIIVNLDNNAYGSKLTSAEQGVSFDIDADGDHDNVAWTKAGSDVAFLVLDRNGNGLVDDGAELFGNATPLSSGQTAPNGFEALADIDNQGNADGRIDSADAVFGALRLWRDLNHDGVSQPSELQSLSDGDVTTIFTAYRESRRTDRHGNRFAYVGVARVIKRGTEHRRVIFDVFFKAVA